MFVNTISSQRFVLSIPFTLIKLILKYNILLLPVDDYLVIKICIW